MFETAKKSGLVCLFRAFIKFFGHLDQFWLILWSKLAKFDLLQTSIWTFYAKFKLTALNCVEKWFCLALKASWFGFGHLELYLTHFGPKWPDLTFYGLYSDILCKIHTQGLKLYGKMALFGSLVLLVRFWCFWPIFGPFLTKMIRISPSTVEIWIFYVKFILRA